MTPTTGDPRLHEIASHLYIFFAHLGGLGLLLLGILDSSFLMMPLGNDLLIVGLTAGQHGRLLYYVAMASLGSTLGCVVTDLIARKGGEEGLHRFISERRLGYIKKKVSNRAGWALALAAVMPPPFPFTPFVAAAAAFNYPRRKMYPILGGFRFLRFLAIGWLAILFGDRILQIADSPVVIGIVIAIVVLAVGGSIYSIYTWLKRSRRATAPGNRAARPQTATD